VAGEPGVGKTRLALRFAGDALGDGRPCCSAAAPRTRSRPFEPFADVLRQIGVDGRAVAGRPRRRELDRVLGHAHGAPPTSAAPATACSPRSTTSSPAWPSAGRCF
jgi:hypothetical protein